MKPAATLTLEEVRKVAHALGWPDPRYPRKVKKGANPWRAPRGRVRWADPYRNNWCGQKDDPDWLSLEARGFAEQRPGPIGSDEAQCYWVVTVAGRTAVRAWFAAKRKALDAAKPDPPAVTITQRGSTVTVRARRGSGIDLRQLINAMAGKTGPQDGGL